MSKDETKSRPTIKQRMRNATRAHRRRHVPTGLQFVIADSIEFLPAISWDALTQSTSCFLSREYLRVLERTAPPGLSARYAMVFDKSTPVAAIAAQLVEINGKKLMTLPESGNDSEKAQSRNLRELLRDFGTSAKRKAIERISGRILVCGNLLSWGQHGVALSLDYPAQTLWPAVAEALYRIRRAERLSGQTDIVMLKDFTQTDEDGILELKDFDYAPLDTDPNMVMEIPASWRSFDDYLSNLASKYRSGAKKIVKDVATAGITLDTVNDVSPYADRIHELYLQVHSKAAVRPVTINSTYIPATAEALGDRFRCTLARRDDDVVGFITSINDGETCVGYYIGFDYEINQSAPLYFRLLQVCIDDAIRFGCRRLSLGRTALDPKARMGAKPEPTRVWLRHRQPVLNWIVKGLLGAIPHDEAPDRNPFKTS